MIEKIDQNAKIALDDESHGRTNDDKMFRINDLAREVVMETTTGVKDSDALITDVTEDEDNMQAMMDADRLLAEKLQAREREEFSEVQKARLSFDEIKKLFDREMTKVNDFIAMDSEAHKSSTKITAEHLKYDISKKQKVDENVKPVIDDSEELRKCT
nr:hypothetical protein [Tanacetum cinerariifolium]